MILYFPQPVFQLGPFEIHAFGITAALAVLIGGRVILLRAHRQGIPVEQMFRFCFWVYASALVGAYLSKAVLDDWPAIFYDPARIFHTAFGVRSVGGISGGFFGGLLWCRYHRLTGFETLKRLDVIAYAMPLAWMWGRLGCALAHDHRGFATTSWIAVQFPEGPRYDLGLIEFLFLVLMVAGFRMLDRHPRPIGFFFGLYGIVYGAFRIWLDTLHQQPARFYGGAAGVIVGLVGWAAMLHYHRRATKPADTPEQFPGLLQRG